PPAGSALFPYTTLFRSEVVFGGESSGGLAAHLRSVNSEKAERARTDLAVLRDALEAFRRERGFYVVAEDSIVLLDYLSPRYIKRSEEHTSELQSLAYLV